MKIRVMIEGRIWNTLGIRQPQSDFILNVAMVTMAASDEPGSISGIVTHVRVQCGYMYVRVLQRGFARTGEEECVEQRTEPGTLFRMGELYHVDQH